MIRKLGMNFLELLILPSNLEQILITSLCPAFMFPVSLCLFGFCDLESLFVLQATEFLYLLHFCISLRSLLFPLCVLIMKWKEKTFDSLSITFYRFVKFYFLLSP